MIHQLSVLCKSHIYLKVDQLDVYHWEKLWEMPLCDFLLIHLKLMLFTNFLQTHQANLRPSDTFSHLSFQRNALQGDANYSNNHWVKTRLGEISGKHKPTRISQRIPHEHRTKIVHMNIWIKVNSASQHLRAKDFWLHFWVLLSGQQWAASSARIKYAVCTSKTKQNVALSELFSCCAHKKHVLYKIHIDIITVTHTVSINCHYIMKTKWKCIIKMINDDLNEICNLHFLI